MRADDLTVTVRDKTLARVGVIPPHLLEGTFVIPDTAVGDWKLRLPADHAMAALLRTPGYGIIVDGPDGTLFSGPMVKSTRDSDYRDEAGTVTIEGVTDEIILWDALAYPPEGFAYDTFTGEPWEIFDHFLDFNLGDLGRFPLGSFGNLLTTDFSAVDGTGGGGGLVTFVDSAFSTTDATSYTFTDVNLGAASADRTIIVCAMTRASTGSVIDDITLDGNTGIEGIPGSGDPADLTFGAGAGASSRGGKWVRFAAPTGTTGTIVVPIVSGTAALCGIMVWSTPYAVEHDPFNNDHSDAGQYGWVGGVTLPADAFALAAHYWETTEDTTWPAGFTDDTLEAIGDGRDAQMAGAHTEETGYVEVDQTGTYTNALGSMIVYTLP